MPPSFMSRISRSSSGLVTDGPNHHQRTIMRASSGGRSKPRRSSDTFTGSAPKANPANSVKSALRLNHGTDISTIVCLRSVPRQAVSEMGAVVSMEKTHHAFAASGKMAWFHRFPASKYHLIHHFHRPGHGPGVLHGETFAAALDPFDAAPLNHR